MAGRPGTLSIVNILLLYNFLLCGLSFATYSYNIKTWGKITHIHCFSLAAAAGFGLFRNLSVDIEYFKNYILILPDAGKRNSKFIADRIGISKNGGCLVCL